MAIISGFTYIHNALEGGFPIVEAIKAVHPFVDEVVVVDCASTDGTKEILEKLPVRIIEGSWGSEAGETLKQACSLNSECKGEIILHFEGDEVFDNRLLREIIISARAFNSHDIWVYRLQIEQNFQRCRWYPFPVHRVFRKGEDVKRFNQEIQKGRTVYVLPPEYGFLWDVTNCFRDNWRRKIENLSKLFDEKPLWRRVPKHFLVEPYMLEEWIEDFLNEPQWTWTETPFNIPEILKPLVGMTKYKPTL